MNESSEDFWSQSEEQTGATGASGRRRTVKEWQALGSLPIWQCGSEKASITVQGVAYTLLALKRDGKIRNNAFDKWVSRLLLLSLCLSCVGRCASSRARYCCCGPQLQLPSWVLSFEACNCPVVLHSDIFQGLSVILSGCAGC